MHGTNYLIQYEIYLTEEIDYFDKFLPICISIRKQIILEKDKYNGMWKLIVLFNNELEKRFCLNPLCDEFIQNLFQTRPSYENNINKKDNLDMSKYYDTYMYSLYILHTSIKPVTQEELQKTEERFIFIKNEINYNNMLSDKELGLYFKEESELRNNLKIHRILTNTEYFEEIKVLYNNLTNIELKNDEKNLIEQVISHPNLNGIISNKGFRLIEEKY